uniref:tRNA threonylcarbamoyladenosine biosynthesis protein TsaE n=1 Tax=candidate division WOR-3 bacterium TaxID=2052148 RepID=A0A7C6AFW2_UNCW3
MVFIYFTNKMSKVKKYITCSSRETITLAKKFARKLKAKDILFLAGELGSGKTTFTKGICLGLEIKEPVTSPSFVIASEYKGKMKVSHIDLYRLKESELSALPIEEYYINDGITIIEWADRLSQFFDRSMKGIYIYFSILKKNEREIRIEDLRD